MVIRNGPALTVEELKVGVSNGSLDTVVVATVDAQGRLQGKRMHAEFVLDEVLAHGTRGSDQLLSIDGMASLVDGDQAEGGNQAGGKRAGGDVVFRPDLSTMRRLPWLPGTALILADLTWPDGRPVEVCPRQILRQQLQRLAGHGLVAQVATTPRFQLYQDSYEELRLRGYRELVPASSYNVDYSLLGTSKVEPLLRRLRTGLAGAGLRPESVKCQGDAGQYQMAFRHGAALSTADNHAIFKFGAKEIAAQEGMALTFMAKPDQLSANPCHIHFSLRTPDGQAAMEGTGQGGLSHVGEQVLAGLLTTLPEFALFYAPNGNSYKRYHSGECATMALGWGVESRACALRVVDRGGSLRVENRVPGSDVNPHLALAAMVAGAVYGIENELPLAPPTRGEAMARAATGSAMVRAAVGAATGGPAAARVPANLRDALGQWLGSESARSAFGAGVVAHYGAVGAAELAAMDTAVTDWERSRGFELR